MQPIPHVRPNTENPFAWFVSSVISPRYVYRQTTSASSKQKQTKTTVTKQALSAINACNM